ncbi:MAG: hypothetical protein ACRERS_01790 [Methylococcales bacterium]
MIGILIAVTPLCGLLFRCGCDWPWFGLMAQCNFFEPRTIHRCPFCEHLPWSIPLLSGSALVGMATTWLGLSRNILPKQSIVLDALTGVAVFVVLTGIARAWF